MLNYHQELDMHCFGSQSWPLGAGSVGIGCHFHQPWSPQHFSHTNLIRLQFGRSGPWVSRLHFHCQILAAPLQQWWHRHVNHRKRCRGLQWQWKWRARPIPKLPPPRGWIREPRCTYIQQQYTVAFAIWNLHNSSTRWRYRQRQELCHVTKSSNKYAFNANWTKIPRFTWPFYKYYCFRFDAIHRKTIKRNRSLKVCSHKTQ
jgi:hypothetical protein